MLGFAASMAERSVVAIDAGAPSGTSRDPSETEIVPKSRRGKVALPTMVNPLLHSARMSVPQLWQAILDLVHRCDVPVTIRRQWLQDIQHLHPGLFKRGLVRLKQQAGGARYPVFFSIDPLVQWLEDFTWESKEVLLKKALVSLRLATLLRSSDVANMPWAIWRHENKFYVKSLNKGGVLQTIAICGFPLHYLAHYMALHVGYPDLGIWRHEKDPGRCLGSERLAKLTLQVMADQGIGTNIFKAHSLRGASATPFLQQGIPKDWVKCRGGWSTCKRLDAYYDRLHQLVDWRHVCKPKRPFNRIYMCSPPLRSPLWGSRWRSGKCPEVHCLRVSRKTEGEATQEAGPRFPKSQAEVLWALWPPGVSSGVCLTSLPAQIAV